MSAFIKFLASKWGRILRALVAVAIGVSAAVYADGTLVILLLVAATLMYLGALLNFCLLSGPSHPKKSSVKSTTITVLVIVIGILGASTYGAIRRDTNQASIISPEVSIKKITVEGSPNTSDDSTPTPVPDSTEQLLYLIEEEKLAHDVYTVFYEKYGSKVFGSILNSESTHQSQVLVLLNARGIPDPRSSQIGIFQNTELQTLYNTLVAKGMENVTEAYDAGVAIEERDIADITNQLATTADADIQATLENLRSGSENHLRAFNRQLR